MSGLLGQADPRNIHNVLIWPTIMSFPNSSGVGFPITLQTQVKRVVNYTFSMKIILPINGFYLIVRFSLNYIFGESLWGFTF
jgi:hypothetical protein